MMNKERLVKMAKNYDNFETFKDELGWEDWMEEFKTDADDDEYLSEQTVYEIDCVLEEIFNKAQEEKENFDKLQLIKEGDYWTLYIGEIPCGCGRFEDMMETMAELDTYEKAKEYVKEV